MSNKTKRKLFEELKIGIEEIRNYKAGKATLRSYKIEKQPFLKIDVATIRTIRE